MKYTNYEIKTFDLLPSLLNGNLTEKEMKVNLVYLHKLHLDSVKELENILFNNVVSIASDAVIIKGRQPKPIVELLRFS